MTNVIELKQFVKGLINKGEFDYTKSKKGQWFFNKGVLSFKMTNSLAPNKNYEYSVDVSGCEDVHDLLSAVNKSCGSQSYIYRNLRGSFRKAYYNSFETSKQPFTSLD